MLCPTIAITCKITFSHIQEKYTFCLCESLQTQYFTFSLSRILKSIYISQISSYGFGLLSGLIANVPRLPIQLCWENSSQKNLCLRLVTSGDLSKLHPVHFLCEYLNTTRYEISWNFLPPLRIPESCIPLITLAFLILRLPSAISREILAYYFLCTTVSMYH